MCSQCAGAKVRRVDRIEVGLVTMLTVGGEPAGRGFEKPKNPEQVAYGRKGGSALRGSKTT